MSTQRKSGAPAWFLTLVGVVLMVLGTYIATSVHLGFVDALNKQGIPLDPGRTIAVIGVLLILFPLVNTFYLKPLVDAINIRNTELERTFTEAEQLRQQMNTMRSEYEQRLVATEAEAREQIQAQIREAQNLRTQLMAEASAKADELVKKASEEIEAEKSRVMIALRTEVVNLTLTATEKILNENMNDDRNRRLVEDFIKAVEVPS